MKRSLVVSILVGSTLFGTAQTITSISDGNSSDPTVWDCTCVPGAVNDVIVNHKVVLDNSSTYASLVISSGGRLTQTGSAFLTVNGSVDIQLNGLLRTDLYTTFHGDLNIDGTWAGSASLDLRGSNNIISGTGVISNTAVWYFRVGPKTIAAGTVLDKSSGSINIQNVVISNNGSMKTSVMTTSGSLARWIQQPNSRIEFPSILTGTLKLEASATGNTVAFTRPGTQQDIWPVIGAEFYNLELASSSSVRRKILSQDITILGDLDMEDCALETRLSGVDSDIEIHGNWTSTGGILLPQTGTVTFANPGPVTITHDDTESFNILLLQGPGAITLAGNATVADDLVINTPFIMDGSAERTVSVGGDLTNNSVYTNNQGRIVMNGSSAQTITGDMVYHDLEIDNSGAGVTFNTGVHDVHGTLSVLAGDLDTDDRLTMVSDADGDSQISEILGGTIIGDVLVQRYIDAGATNWRFLTSPTQSNSIGDWTDDFTTSGFTGSTWPTFSFTSIYFHDETAPGTLDDGFIAATDVTDPIGSGQGVWVWCGDSLQGTAPFTIDVTGEVYQGDINLPVSYTSYGNPADDGWNMVANPYVSVIDWDDPDWVKTGINDAIYIWVPELEQFASYVGGVGVNGGSRYVASSQAFWVQTNSSSPQLTAKESVKSDVAVGFRSTAVQDNDVLRLSLSRNGISDQLVIRYNGNASNDFDSGFDALERISPTTTAPNFHSVSADGKDLMINTLKPVINDTLIQLAFKVNQGGTFDVNFDEVAGRFSSSCIILEDQITGTETHVEEGVSISVSLVPGQNENRFRLRISGTIEAEQFPVSCPGASDGMLVAHASGVGPWNYRWYNATGILIRTSGPIAGPDTLQALSPGNYSVSVTVQNTCGQITADMDVLDAQPLDPNETITASLCTGQGDGMIELNLAGDADNYGILWSDGSTGESLTNLLAGDYTVTITTAGGCIHEFTFTVPMENQAVAAFSAPSTASVNQPIIFQSTSQAATTLTWDMGDGASYNVQAPMHQYTAPGTYTVKLTAVNNACSDVYTQDILIEAIANSINDFNGSAGITFEQIDGRIYLMNNGQRSRSMSVMINNILGQNIGLPMNRKFDVGRTFLDVGDASGTVVIITAIDHLTGQRYGKRFLL